MGLMVAFSIWAGTHNPLPKNNNMVRFQNVGPHVYMLVKNSQWVEAQIQNTLTSLMLAINCFDGNRWQIGGDAVVVGAGKS